jgi:hypothetical protein
MDKNTPEVVDMNDPQNKTPENNTPADPSQLAANAFQKDSEKPVPAGIDKKKLKPHKRFAAWRKNLTKKQKIIFLVLAILLIAGVAFGAYKFLQGEKTPSVNQANPAKPTTVQSKMTGLQVAPEVNEKQVTGVMIENSPDARPQSGLLQAGFVFEAIAEGGITRFLALYQDTTADYIGPVRSVRPYYLDVVASYDAAIAHVGGSPDALAKIKAMGIKDLDQFQNPGAYERVRNRAAPHNVYTSSAKLEAVEQQKGYTKSEYTGFEHARAEEKSATVTAKTINLNISSALYNVRYDYDPTTNAYLRFVGGAPATDEKSGKQLSPKAVIAIETNRTQNGVYSVYGMTGSGKVTIFQNGTVIGGTWERPQEKSQYVFKNEAGQVVKVVPGQAWMTLVTPGGVTYAP